MDAGSEHYLGQIAGIATSALWTATALLFTSASRRIGPTAVNFTRILFAIAFLSLTHRLISNAWIPEAQSWQVIYLALSGVIGLSIGDQALFTAFVDIGPRLSMLIMTTAPLYATLFGWLALNERLSALAWAGMLLTVTGVAWVTLERPKRQRPEQAARRWRGILLAFIAAACQAGGLLLSKQGIGHGWLPRDDHMSTLSATLWRMSFAGAGLIPWVLYRHFRSRKRSNPHEYANPNRLIAGLLFAVGGAIAGPYLGVWMSLTAGDLAPLGVAQTLMSLTPIFILPFVIKIYGESVSMRAALGAALAVTGTALLFLT